MAILDESWRAEQKGAAPALFGILAVLSMVPILLEFGGFRLADAALLPLRLLSLGFAGAFVLQFAIGLRAAQDFRAYLRSQLVDVALIVVLLLSFLLVFLHPFGFFEVPGLRSYVRPAQIYLVLNLILKTLHLFKLAASRRFNYARAFVISFLAIISIGVLLLFLLPGTKAPGRELELVDAVFTATSATCVTGLVTVDTGTHFSRFGQTIILVLFQVGGLGLMTFAAFFTVALGKGMGIKDRQVMKGVLDLHVVGTVVRVIVGILFITLLIEGVSTVILYTRMGAGLASQDRFFHSAFHAVSAFCNAGFSLHETSLMAYVNDPVVNVVVMGEIVIGGLGFAVLLDLFGVRLLGARLFAWLGLIPQAEAGRERRRLSVQTRIVLIATATLILTGAGLFLLFEAQNPATLGGLGAGSKVQAALFQSITARTAGFNTVPTGELTGASKFLTVVLMIIGASPGSTGGGVKTVTSVVLLLTLISFYRNRRRVEIFRRTLPDETVRKSIVIVVTAFAIVTSATLVLVALEGGRHDFLSILFEVGSAFGTVGLSTGITGSLCTASKLTLCVVMLVGRIGPLSLVIALSQARVPRGYEYPEEHVMIG